MATDRDLLCQQMHTAAPLRAYTDIIMTSQHIRRETEIPKTMHTAIEPTDLGKCEISVYTDIGGRKAQEDRVTVCPALCPGRDDCAFFGVFDGTVGDFASETVKDLVVPHLVASPDWQKAVKILKEGSEEDLQRHLPELLERAVDYMYKNSDSELISLCAKERKDYASSTAVTALLAAGHLAVGHLGDSRIALGGEQDGQLIAKFLTYDHKPDQPAEKDRIAKSGGSVEYLQNHNNKPFIRGGDFGQRKAAGEQPMQLQYSRAFGGKDLKGFGLSNQPDLRVVRLKPNHRCMILASDGLWDVLNVFDAISIAMRARSERRNPAEALVQYTLEEQKSKNQASDNITVVVVFFK